MYKIVGPTCTCTIDKQLLKHVGPFLDTILWKVQSMFLPVLLACLLHNIAVDGTRLCLPRYITTCVATVGTKPTVYILLGAKHFCPPVTN